MSPGIRYNQHLLFACSPQERQAGIHHRHEHHLTSKHGRNGGFSIDPRSPAIGARSACPTGRPGVSIMQLHALRLSGGSSRTRRATRRADAIATGRSRTTSKSAIFVRAVLLEEEAVGRASFRFIPSIRRIPLERRKHSRYRRSRVRGIALHPVRCRQGV